MNKENQATLKKFVADDFKRMASWSLDEKIAHSKAVIELWIKAWDGKVAVSFSGGKDSTALLHLVRQVYPECPAVFSNTGLEYPSIVKHVKSFDNVTIIRPKKMFRDVIAEYGYPLFSKRIAATIACAKRQYARVGKDYDFSQGGNASLKGMLRPFRGKYDRSKYVSMLDSDFLIGSGCCYHMKKRPIELYEKENGIKCFVGTMANEGTERRNSWEKFGCNAFDAAKPTSRPLSVWTNDDVLRYTLKYDLPLAKPYGEIVEGKRNKLCTTGCQRTVCIFCGFGAHLDKGLRFRELAHNEPKLYDYMMRGGEYNDKGLWILMQKGWDLPMYMNG